MGGCRRTVYQHFGLRHSNGAEARPAAYDEARCCQIPYRDCFTGTPTGNCCCAERQGRGGYRRSRDDRSEVAIVLAGRAELKMLASAAVTVTGSGDQFLLAVEKGLIIYTMADIEEVQQVVTPNTALRL